MAVIAPHLRCSTCSFRISSSCERLCRSSSAGGPRALVGVQKVSGLGLARSGPVVSRSFASASAAARSMMIRSHGSGASEHCGPAVSMTVSGSACAAVSRGALVSGSACGNCGFLLRGLTVGRSTSVSMRATLAACLSACGQLTWQSESLSVSVSLPHSLALRFPAAASPLPLGPISPLSACE